MTDDGLVSKEDMQEQLERLDDELAEYGPPEAEMYDDPAETPTGKWLTANGIDPNEHGEWLKQQIMIEVFETGGPPEAVGVILLMGFMAGAAAMRLVHERRDSMASDVLADLDSLPEVES